MSCGHSEHLGLLKLPIAPTSFTDLVNLLTKKLPVEE